MLLEGRKERKKEESFAYSTVFGSTPGPSRLESLPPYHFFLQRRHDLVCIHLLCPKWLLEDSPRDELDRLVEMRDQVGSGHEDIWRREEEAIQSQVAEATHQVGPGQNSKAAHIANHFDVAGKGGSCGGQKGSRSNRSLQASVSGSVKPKGEESPQRCPTDGPVAHHLQNIRQRGVDYSVVAKYNYRLALGNHLFHSGSKGCHTCECVSRDIYSLSLTHTQTHTNIYIYIYGAGGNVPAPVSLL